MSNIIDIKLRKLNTEPDFDISAVLPEFWKRVCGVIKRYANNTASKQIYKFYYSDCVENHLFTEGTLSLVFPTPGGTGELSSLLSYHWTMLALTINQEGFNSFFRSMGWELAKGFESIENFKSGVSCFFFEHEKQYYGITKDSKGKAYIIYDYGFELNIEELPTHLQKKNLTLLENKHCACSFCSKIGKGKMKTAIIKKNNLPKNVKFSKSYAKALKYAGYVEELDLRRSNEKLTPEIVTLKKLKKLDVSWNYIEFLPDELCELPLLEELNISSNWLKSIPGNIGKLTNLKVFKCDQAAAANIETLPSSFGLLFNLEELELTGNVFKHVPEQLLNLKKLKKLNLQNCTLLSKSADVFPFDNFKMLEHLNLRYTGLSVLPEPILGMSDLTSLDCSRNSITRIPEKINQLSKLESLTLSENQIAEIPGSVYSMQNLRWLSLSENPITRIDDKISNLHKLEALDLSKTKLDTIPESIGQLKELRTMYINNEIQSLPASLKNCTKLKSVYTYGGAERIKPMLVKFGLEKVEVY